MTAYRLLMIGLAVALMGAGCNFTPLSVEESKDNEPVMEEKETPKPKPNDGAMMEDPEKDPESEMEKDPGESMEKPEMVEEEPGEAMEKPKGTGYGGKVIGDLTMKADENSVVVFLTAEKAEYKGDDAYMEFGCESLLVPVRRTLTKTQSDLAHAIVELITIKETAYFDQGLRNAVAPSAPTIKLTNIHYEDGVRVIDFEGSFLSAGTCDDPRIKAQIEETVKLYTDKYRIQLNGKESEWRCLFDQSGLCE